MNPKNPMLFFAPSLPLDSLSNAVNSSSLLGIKPIGVKMDSEGMMPDDLDKILEGWDVSTQGKKPSLVVFVPTGSNPSGTTMSGSYFSFYIWMIRR